MGITAVSMLLSTAFSMSPNIINNNNKSLPFNKAHKMQCLQLLNNLLRYDLYTKPDPNNPNFNLNCMRARGCIAENINYLTSNSLNDECYTLIITIIYKLAHCPMNVEITEEKQDDDEKLNDREPIESV